MIYKYLTHPLYCHMTLTKGDVWKCKFGPKSHSSKSPSGDLGAERKGELSICKFDYERIDF